MLQKCINQRHHESMTQEQLAQWFFARTGEKSARAIAARTGIDASVMNRQLNGVNEIKIGTAVAIARAYSIPVSEVFVAAGWITELEASLMGAQQALEMASDEQLIAEVLRRIDRGSASAVITEPVDELTIRDVRPIRAWNDGGFLDDAVHQQELETAAGTDETQADDE